MKLIDLVNLIQDAGLQAQLSASDRKTLCLHALTMPPADAAGPDILFGVIIKNGKSAFPADNAEIIKLLDKAATHPHAIRQREFAAEWERRECAERIEAANGAA